MMRLIIIMGIWKKECRLCTCISIDEIRAVKHFYAHSKDGAPPEDRQPLEQQLANVAEWAAEFAKPVRRGGSGHESGEEV